MGSSGSKAKKKDEKDDDSWKPPRVAGLGRPGTLSFTRSNTHEKIMTGAEYHREFPGLSVKFLRAGMSHWSTHSTHQWKLGMNRGTLSLTQSNGAGLYFAHHTGSETRTIVQFGTVAYRVRIPENAWVIAEPTKGWFRSNAVWLEELSIERCSDDNEERRMVESLLMVGRDHTSYTALAKELKVAVVTDLFVGQLKQKSLWSSTTKSQVVKKYRSRYT